MTSSKFDKFFATLICVTAIGGFIAHPNVSAAPVFPPAHFTPSARIPVQDNGLAMLAVGPWYRPGVPRSEIEVGRGLDFAADLAVTPWYRAAN